MLLIKKTGRRGTQPCLGLKFLKRMGVVVYHILLRLSKFDSATLWN